MDTHTSNGTHGSAGLSTDAEDLLRRLRSGELIPPPPVEQHAETDAQTRADSRAPRPSLRAALAARLPVGVRGASLDPALRGALGLGLVALVAALVALGLVWRSAPRPMPVSTAPAVIGPSVGATTAALPGAVPKSASPPSAVVDVAGKVRHPGVVSLPAGARVADALDRAGGVLPGTDTSALSLARKVVDGEQILVTGQPGTAAPPAPAALAPATGTSSAADGTGTGGSGTSSGNAPAAPTTPLDLNSATVEQFDGLPGVGPVLAGRIVEYRTAHNGFTSVDQLREVKGLGGKIGQQLLPLVRVG